MNVPSLCTAGNIGWALPMNIASMWGFSLENGGVSKSGVRTVYRPSVRGVHLRPRGAVLLGAVGARAVCVWSRGRRRTKLSTGVRDFIQAKSPSGAAWHQSGNVATFRHTADRSAATRSGAQAGCVCPFGTFFSSSCCASVTQWRLELCPLHHRSRRRSHAQRLWCAHRCFRVHCARPAARPLGLRGGPRSRSERGARSPGRCSISSRAGC